MHYSQCLGNDLSAMTHENLRYTQLMRFPKTEGMVKEKWGLESSESSSIRLPTLILDFKLSDSAWMHQFSVCY